MKQKICERILKWVQIIDCKGTVRLCGWINDDVIGVLSDQSMKEIYHGKRAEELRKKLMEKDYSQCRVDGCPYLAMNTINQHLIEMDKLPEYPEELYLAYENICNYRCTSCYVPVAMHENVSKNMETDYAIIEEQLKEVLPHVKKIGANGLGELFVSKNILKILSEWKPLAPADEVEVLLETNGSLFDEAHWKQIENLGQYHLSVHITVMSFDEPTYQFLSGTKLPIAQIENNLHFVKKLREQGVVDFFEIATVVQERNFRTMPEFARKCVEEFGADSVRLRPYEPWGSRDPEIEWFTDVRNPEHPYYKEYREIMEDEIFRHPCVHDWSGGRDTVNVKEFPYKFSYMKEQILTQLVLKIDQLIEKLNDCAKGKPIVLYGLGNVGQVLIKLLIERGVYPEYILDKHKSCKEFCGIQVYHLQADIPFEKNVYILITPLKELEKIKNDLRMLGYEGDLKSIKEFLGNI